MSMSPGFVPVLEYWTDPDHGTPRENVAEVDGVLVNGSWPLVFDTTHVYPVLPLRWYGHICHSGWEIPTIAAVDANDAAWKDYAHGGPLEPCDAKTLISQWEKQDGAYDAARKALQEVP